jgi:DNA-binding MltR family transcriptional regulator
MPSAKSIIRSLKKYTRAEPDLIEQLLHREDMRNDRSDRAAAIFTGIELEEATRRALVSWVRLDNSDEYDGLFGAMGPLSTFSARIKTLFVLRLIGKDTRDDLDIIREIRNAFAHSGRELTFDTKEVKAACEHLRAVSWNTKPGIKSAKGRHESEARFQYRVAAKHIILQLQLIDPPQEEPLLP